MPDTSAPELSNQSDVLDVLVVDDEEMVLSVVGQIIEAHGHHVRVAIDSRQALDALHDQACDLLVTDIRMPGMSGLELVQQVRDEYPSVRVVLMTGYAAEQSREEIDRLDVDGFLKKPFKARELTQLIDGIG